MGFQALLATSSLSRYFALLAAVWMVVMAWRLYPQFKDAVRIGGHVITIDDFVARRCGDRTGPDGAACRAAAFRESQRLLRREQSRSILMVIAPVFFYVAFYLSALWLDRRRGSLTR